MEWKLPGCAHRFARFGQKPAQEFQWRGAQGQHCRELPVINEEVVPRRVQRVYYGYLRRLMTLGRRSDSDFALTVQQPHALVQQAAEHHSPVHRHRSRRVKPCWEGGRPRCRTLVGWNLGGSHLSTIIESKAGLAGPDFNYIVVRVRAAARVYLLPGSLWPAGYTT